MKREEDLSQFVPASRELVLHFALRRQLLNLEPIEFAGEEAEVGDKGPVGGHRGVIGNWLLEIRDWFRGLILQVLATIYRTRFT